MDKLENYRYLIGNILSSYIQIPYHNQPEINKTIIISQDRNHYLIIKEGWEGKKHIHHCLFHAEIKDNKIWIYFDGFEESITEELISAGVSKDEIILAFHPPYIRQQEATVTLPK